MGRHASYNLTTRSIADFLLEIEARWGIVLEFKINFDPNPFSNGALIIELDCKHPIHQREVPTFTPSKKWIQDNDGNQLVFVMWDMLLDSDREMVGNVFIE